MASAVAELDTALQAMQALKPPGVSGSKINSITALCNANVQSESVLIQKIYTHFKRTPATHKLGVLYVVDSVTRQWAEQAKKTGQPSGSAATDGTAAAGVNRVTELMPVLMSDIIQTAPADQKEKIKKLVDIWERGGTFPAPMLNSFKEKLNAPPPTNARSTTPAGSPPRDLPLSLGQQQPNASSAAATNSTAILAALANMAKQNTIPTSTTPTPLSALQGNTNNVPNLNSAIPSATNASVTQPLLQSNGQPVVMPSTGAALGSQLSALGAIAQQAPSSNQANPLAALANALSPAANGASAPPDQLQQLMLLQLLISQNIPQDQWPSILAALGQTTAVGTGSTPFNPVASTPWSGPGQNGWPAPSQSRDVADLNEASIRSPQGRYRQRSRSRSPSGWDRGEGSSTRRRDSPVYGEYNGQPGRGDEREESYDRKGRSRGGRGRGNDYRQRSPQPSHRRSPSPQKTDLPPPGPKWVEYDYSIGQGNIKVYSRTLFVGGVTSSENDLRAIFSQFGTVQTCIVNTDKRHAFVKMLSRKDAVAARDGMDHNKSSDHSLRTRWGVGYGPRDCSDYQTGISIIPIDRLTEADRKWMLTAEYGGSGGKPIETGLCVEEPDIEIGAGVSSKAISRRMVTDQSGKHGPRSTRGGENAPRFRQQEQNNQPDQNSSAMGMPPAMPGFGFQFATLPNGMPMFPNFVIPGAGNGQPPPPGHSG